MRQAGSESWRFAHDINQTLHALLYVRDAIGLDVEQTGGIPPRLAGEVPDRSAPLGPEDRRDAARDWPEWWHGAVASQARTQLEPPSARTERWLQEITERHRLVADPPEWSSLAGSPALQQAARALFLDGCRWAGPASQPWQPPSHQEVFE